METERQFHTISPDAFDAVSYGNTAPEFNQSFEGLVLSSRKILLHQFLNRAHEYDGYMPEALSTVDDAFAVLSTMYRANKGAVDELLLAPATGNWLAQTVGRLKKEAPDAEQAWQDIGFFNSIVAGFALKHGVNFTLAMPVIGGELHVPQQGTLLVEPEQADVVTVTGAGGKLQLQWNDRVISDVDPAIETSVWKPVQRLIAHGQVPKEYHDIYGAEMSLSVLLDDADPYNAGPDVRRLTSDEVEQWTAILGEAWPLIVQASPNLALQLSAGLSVIVPYPQNKPFEAYSSSSNANIGSIRASLPTSTLEAAEALVHEYAGHSSLNKFLLATPLTSHDTAGSTLYAPWRDDPRPSGGVLHGIYSFSRVVDFYDAVHRVLALDDPRIPLVNFERRLWQSQASDCARDLYNLWYEKRRQLTEDQFPISSVMAKTLGLLPYGEIRIRHPITEDPIRALLTNAMDYITTKSTLNDKAINVYHNFEVPPDILGLVALAKADHRALWKAHHVKAIPATIDQLSNAWLSGGDRTIDSVAMTVSYIETDPSACKLHARALLMRHFLSNPEKFTDEFEQSTDLMDRADRALILGKNVVARVLYGEVLEQEPLNKRAFIGAGLSDRQGNQTSSSKFFTSWLRRPYILLSLQESIIDKSGHAVDYDDLYEWFLGNGRS